MFLTRSSDGTEITQAVTDESPSVRTTIGDFPFREKEGLIFTLGLVRDNFSPGILGKSYYRSPGEVRPVKMSLLPVGSVHCR